MRLSNEIDEHKNTKHQDEPETTTNDAKLLDYIYVQSVKERAKFLVERNTEFIIFWAVLFFTCVVGMIELNGVIVPNSFTFPKTDNLPQLAKEIILSENTWATAIYYALLSGMLVSIEKCWRIYMRNAEFTRSGELGEKIKRFNKQYPTFIDSLFKYKSLAQNENRCHDEHRELSRTAKGQLIYYLLYALSIIGFSLWHLTHIGILQYFFV